MCHRLRRHDKPIPHSNELRQLCAQRLVRTLKLRNGVLPNGAGIAFDGASGGGRSDGLSGVRCGCRCRRRCSCWCCWRTRHVYRVQQLAPRRTARLTRASSCSCSNKRVRADVEQERIDLCGVGHCVVVGVPACSVYEQGAEIRDVPVINSEARTIIIKIVG
jgi:hypothetical protein